jgi:CheY-like chemotaxis protein
MNHKPTILLIDDEDYFHKIFNFSYQKRYNIINVYNETDARKAIEEHDFDLVLTDLNLEPTHEDLTGLDLIETFKSIRPNLPCIAVTSVQRTYLPDRAFEVGADEYLHKDNFDAIAWRNLIDKLIPIFA